MSARQMPWRPVPKAKKEVPLQHALCKHIEGKGGCADQLTNKFVRGVPDLLIKLREHDSMLIEAKRNLYTTITTHIPLGLTVLQFNVLKKWNDAGMRCGVLSFKLSQVRGALPDTFALLSFDRVSAIREPYTKRNSGEESYRYRVPVAWYRTYDDFDAIYAALEVYAKYQRDSIG